MYVGLTVVALALSGLFTPSGAKAVAYDEAVKLVEEDKVDAAVVRGDEVVLTLKPEEGKPPAHLRTARLPSVADEPLVKALLDKKVRIDAQSPVAPWWIQAAWWVVPLLLINGLFYFSMKRMGPNGAAGPLGFLKTKTKVYDKKKTEAVHFSDVAGVEEAKEQLVEVVQFLKEPSKFQALGGRIPRGLLLIGPPGTGKTLLARAVAGEAGVPFYSLNASEFVEMFVGLGAARVRDLFEQARKSAPAIVFIDEIDAVGRSRGGLGALATHDEREQTLHQLLAELDGFDKSATVILMAATNRPEVLDPALLRPGRFDRQVIVDRPDLDGRDAILRVHAKKLPLGDNVDLGLVARRTPGMAGADLANIVNEAALAGARRGGAIITMVDFEEALDRVQLGLRRRGRLMTASERRRVAYHEAGHALVALSQPEADPIDRVSIVARTMGSLGATIQLPRDERKIITEQEIDARVMVMLGGRAGEEIGLGDVSSGAHDDLERATLLVREMVTRLGMSHRLGLASLSRNVGPGYLGQGGEERICSDQTAREVDEEVRDRIADGYARAKQLLSERRDALEAVAEALVERETLTGIDIERLVERASQQRRLKPVSAA